MKPIVGVVLFFLIITFYSCGDKIKGSGNIITNDYLVNSANEIILEADFDFIINQTDTTSVSISADDNIIPHIRVAESNGVVRVYYDTKEYRLRPTQQIKVFIETPDMDYLSADYDAYVEFNNFTTDYLHLENRDADMIIDNLIVNFMDLDNYENGLVSIYGLDNDTVLAYNGGGGLIELSGYGYYGDYLNNGSGNIYADYMQLYVCDVTIESSGSVSILPEALGWVDMDFKLGSTGWIYLRTEPEHIADKGSGTGGFVIGIPEDFKNTNSAYYSKKK